jgi:hypothetical protein
MPPTGADDWWRPFPLQVLNAPFREEFAGPSRAGYRSFWCRIGAARLAEGTGPSREPCNPTSDVKNSLDTSRFVFLTTRLVGVA